MGYYVPVPAEHNLDPIKKRTDQQPGFEYTSETIFVKPLTRYREKALKKNNRRQVANVPV